MPVYRCPWNSIIVVVTNLRSAALKSIDAEINDTRYSSKSIDSRMRQEHHVDSEATTGRERRRFSWHRSLFALGLVGCLIWWATYVYTGYQHRAIAQSLESRGNNVTFTHYTTVTGAASPNARFTPIMEVSTLHPLIESTGLALLYRRIDSVTIRTSHPANLDRSLSELERLGSVSNLSFYSTGVTEQSLASLLSNIQVRKLYIPSESLSRRQMPCLNHEGLEWLCVSRTQFSNPAIDSLPVSLKYLDATRTRINDEGLAKFERLRNLEKLILRRTPTSQEAVDDLRTRMPWCRIDWHSLSSR